VKRYYFFLVNAFFFGMEEQAMFL